MLSQINYLAWYTLVPLKGWDMKSQEPPRELLQATEYQLHGLALWLPFKTIKYWLFKINIVKQH